MKNQDLLFNFIEKLTNPILILEEEHSSYSVIYKNESMKKVLGKNNLESMENNTLLNTLSTYIKNNHSSGTYIPNVELSDKFYNINFFQNSNQILVTFMETNVDVLFETLSFHDMGLSSSALIIVLDEEGKIVDVNDYFLEISEMDKDKVINQEFFKTFIPADSTVLKQHLEDILKNNSKNKQFITSLKNAKENIYKIKWQVSKMKKLNQNFIIAIGSDISQIIEENNNFKKEIQSIKVGFKYFPFAVAYMDSKGFFTTMNQNFIKMFHISNETSKINFDQISFLKKHIGFSKINENIKFVKEMNFNIKHPSHNKKLDLKVTVRMIKGKNNSSALYIVIIQKTG